MGASSQESDEVCLEGKNVVISDHAGDILVHVEKNGVGIPEDNPHDY
jgi:hypothetical protein